MGARGMQRAATADSRCDLSLIESDHAARGRRQDALLLFGWSLTFAPKGAIPHLSTGKQ